MEQHDETIYPDEVRVVCGELDALVSADPQKTCIIFPRNRTALFRRIVVTLDAAALPLIQITYDDPGDMTVDDSLPEPDVLVGPDA